jgi:hypothetical protein
LYRTACASLGAARTSRHEQHDACRPSGDVKGNSVCLALETEMW